MNIGMFAKPAAQQIGLLIMTNLKKINLFVDVKMTPAQVRRKLATINKNQEKWDAAERVLQAMCLHPNVSKKYDGSTGNWDPNDDCYWIEFKCPDCGKKWIEDR